MSECYAKLDSEEEDVSTDEEGVIDLEDYIISGTKRSGLTRIKLNVYRIVNQFTAGKNVLLYKLHVMQPVSNNYSSSAL